MSPLRHPSASNCFACLPLVLQPSTFPPVPMVMQRSGPISGGRVAVSCSSSVSSAATPPAAWMAPAVTAWSAVASFELEDRLQPQIQLLVCFGCHGSLTSQRVAADEEGPAGAAARRLLQRLLSGAVDVSGGLKDALHGG